MGFLDNKKSDEVSKADQRAEEQRVVHKAEVEKAHSLLNLVAERLPGVQLELWEVLRLSSRVRFSILVEDLAISVSETRGVPNPKLSRETRLDRFFGTYRDVPRTVPVYGPVVSVLGMLTAYGDAYLDPIGELYIEDLNPASLIALIDSLQVSSGVLEAGKAYVIENGKRCEV